jgi:hypothetical protein
MDRAFSRWTIRTTARVHTTVDALKLTTSFRYRSVCLHSTCQVDDHRRVGIAQMNRLRMNPLFESKATATRARGLRTHLHLRQQCCGEQACLMHVPYDLQDQCFHRAPTQHWHSTAHSHYTDQVPTWVVVYSFKEAKYWILTMLFALDHFLLYTVCTIYVERQQLQSVSNSWSVTVGNRTLGRKLGFWITTVIPNVLIVDSYSRTEHAFSRHETYILMPATSKDAHGWCMLNANPSSDITWSSESCRRIFFTPLVTTAYEFFAVRVSSTAVNWTRVKHWKIRFKCK